jgi:hypothetical protein
MMNRDIAYYQRALWDVQNTLKNEPELSEELREMLTNLSTFCRKKIVSLRYIEEQARIISQN